MDARRAWVAGAGRPLRGQLRVPGDKSVSHRALMLGALAEGETLVHGFLESADTIATARILGQLGVRIETPGPGQRRVHGVGLHGLHAPARALDCGNSGTGMRLLAGLLAGQGFDSTLVGDASLSTRPMRRVVDPLAAMGARIDTARGGVPPLRIRGSQRLRGTNHELQVASAQVKSALLLAGLYAEGRTSVAEPRPTRDYTERMLAAFGWPVESSPGCASLTGGHRLRPTEVEVPGDFSSAAFFLVAATVVPGSDLLLANVGLDPRRTGLLEVLRSMGADITVVDTRSRGGGAVGDLRVRYAQLTGVEVPEAVVPDMIDEFPALFVAAACASGETVVRGAAELRVKESDRIASMAAGLRELGASVDEAPDGARIRGPLSRGGSVDAAGDHRIAMALAVAAQCTPAPVEVRDVANVATSFPGFAALAAGVGMGLEEARVSARE